MEFEDFENLDCQGRKRQKMYRNKIALLTGKNKRIA